MATATLNPVLTSISGSVGGIVLYQRRGVQVMRRRIMPPNPRTGAQQANRSRFRDAMKSWQGLPDYEKDSYNRRARKLRLTGHNLYISRYMKKDGNDNTNACNGTQRQADMQTSTGTELIPIMPPLGVRGLYRYMKRRAVNDNVNPGCGEGFSPHVAPGDKRALSNAASSFHPAFRSVTAPSPQANRVFSLPAADDNPPGCS